jgi:hypothetical protein
MPANEYLKWYFRSPVGIGNIFASLLGGIVAVSAGIVPILGVSVSAGVLLAAGLGAYFTGLGPAAAVKARDAGLDKERAQKLRQVAVRRATLSLMRIPDAEVAAAVQLVALAADEYLEACEKEKNHDPYSDAAVDEAADLVSIYFRELDEASREKRFGLPDADPFADSAARVVSGLKDKAAVLREGRMKIEGGLPAVARMAIREELR